MIVLVGQLNIPYQLFVIAATFGGVVAFLIFTLGKISGAHINPAVTIALGLTNSIGRKLVVPYLTSQLLGGLAAAFLLLILLPQGSTSLNLGSTALAANVQPWLGIILEMVGTFFLVFVILIVSRENLSFGHQALIVGYTLFALILIFGPLTGASFNPARSIGPALASTHLDNILVYILGPGAGAVLASSIQRFVLR